MTRASFVLVNDSLDAFLELYEPPAVRLLDSYAFGDVPPPAPVRLSDSKNRTSVGQLEDHETPASHAGQQGSAAWGDPAQSPNHVRVGTSSSPAGRSGSPERTNGEVPAVGDVGPTLVRLSDDAEYALALDRAYTRSTAYLARLPRTHDESMSEMLAPMRPWVRR